MSRTITVNRSPEELYRFWRQLQNLPYVLNHIEQVRGTAVEVSLKYDPPGGKVGATLASWFGNGVENKIEADLRRFESIMETGEAPVAQL